jgi:hypothetical protein
VPSKRVENLKITSLSLLNAIGGRKNPRSSSPFHRVRANTKTNGNQFQGKGKMKKELYVSRCNSGRLWMPMNCSEREWLAALTTLHEPPVGVINPHHSSVSVGIQGHLARSAVPCLFLGLGISLGRIYVAQQPCPIQWYIRNHP